jgi:hypothetical protein
MVKRREQTAVACTDFEETLILYYYGECSESESDRVQAHLKDCPQCDRFVEDLRTILPLTIREDNPSEAFWEGYQREIREELARLPSKSAWSGHLSSLVSPWSFPTFATAGVLLLALALTLTKSTWGPTKPDIPPHDEAILEVLPMAENLEFFAVMEFLDSMDVLETPGALDNGFS